MMESLRTVPRGRRNDTPERKAICRPLGRVHDGTQYVKSPKLHGKIEILTDILIKAIDDLGSEVFVEQFHYAETNRTAVIYACGKALAERIEPLVVVPRWVHDPETGDSISVKEADIHRRFTLPCGWDRRFVTKEKPEWKPTAPKSSPVPNRRRASGRSSISSRMSRRKSPRCTKSTRR